MIKIIQLFIVGALISSCVATGNVTLEVEDAIQSPKIIALNINNGGPWMREIEKRLKKEGFRVLRASSTNEAIETDGKKLIKYNEASTRYFLLVDAMAPVDFMNRCFGGGYNFDYINADLIDLQTNETIASIEGRGYSENCPPMSGKIYTNITKLVIDSWN